MDVKIIPIPNIPRVHDVMITIIEKLAKQDTTVSRWCPSRCHDPDKYLESARSIKSYKTHAVERSRNSYLLVDRIGFC